QRVGDDAAGGWDRENARNRVLWTMQQDAQQKPALRMRVKRRSFGATPPTRRPAILCILSRHSSSPEVFRPGFRIAPPASASRSCLTAAGAALSRKQAATPR